MKFNMQITKIEKEQIKKILGKKGLPKKREVMELVKAYASEKTVQPDYEYFNAPKTQIERDLKWRASKPVNGEDLTRFMCEIVPDYNAFDCKEHTKKLAEMFPAADFYMAREGSVAIYVDGNFSPPDDLEDLCKKVDADECNIRGNDTPRPGIYPYPEQLSDLKPADIWKAGQLRIWWD